VFFILLEVVGLESLFLSLYADWTIILSMNILVMELHIEWMLFIIAVRIRTFDFLDVITGNGGRRRGSSVIH
jgi:hypothetical protein